MKKAKSTVYHVVKGFKAFGTSEIVLGVDDHAVWSKKMIKSIQESVRKDPKRSARQMTKDMIVSVNQKWCEAASIHHENKNNTSHVSKSKNTWQSKDSS